MCDNVPTFIELPKSGLVSMVLFLSILNRKYRRYQHEQDIDHSGIVCGGSSRRYELVRILRETCEVDLGSCGILLESMQCDRYPQHILIACGGRKNASPTHACVTLYMLCFQHSFLRYTVTFARVPRYSSNYRIARAAQPRERSLSGNAMTIP